jgi:hypothetical protein
VVLLPWIALTNGKAVTDATRVGFERFRDHDHGSSCTSLMAARRALIQRKKCLLSTPLSANHIGHLRGNPLLSRRPDDIPEIMTDSRLRLLSLGVSNRQVINLQGIAETNWQTSQEHRDAGFSPFLEEYS